MSAASTAPDTVARAFVWACTLDVLARKPGNVSVASPGHRMEAGMFIASAEAASGPLCAPGNAVGRRIEEAVAATQAAVQCNTNLGIVLLCAPMSAACESWLSGSGLPAFVAALEHTLRRLDRTDAEAAFRAIALAQPAGLGQVPDHDVAEPASIGLREAMMLASSRDRVAGQYAKGYADVVQAGLPAFVSGCRSAAAQGRSPGDAAVQGMQRAYLEFLAGFADSHIVRKQGAAVAHSVMSEAVPWRTLARTGAWLQDDPAFAAWDASLKTRSLNPGTSADLSVATAFLAALSGAVQVPGRSFRVSERSR